MHIIIYIHAYINTEKYACMHINKHYSWCKNMFFPNVLASVTFTLSLVLSKFDINLSLLPLANYDIKYQGHPHTSPKVVCA